MIEKAAGLQEIVEKWYRRLGFDKKYDDAFYACLAQTDLSDLTDFASYNSKENSPQKNLLACLFFCEDLEQAYCKRGISQQILLDSLQDVVIWNNSYYDVHGEIGLTEFPWLDRTFLMQIFRLGRLQFCVTSSWLDIAQLGIRKGDRIIDVHIPRGASLRYEDCVASFEQAKQFFATYYPDSPREWCICYSWLLDDTMLPLLGEHSNIAKFQTFFKPVHRDVSDAVIRFTFHWNTTRETVGDCVPTSRFTKQLQAAAVNGQTFYEVLGIHKL